MLSLSLKGLQADFSAILAWNMIVQPGHIHDLNELHIVSFDSIVERSSSESFNWIYLQWLSWVIHFWLQSMSVTVWNRKISTLSSGCICCETQLSLLLLLSIQCLGKVTISYLSLKIKIFAFKHVRGILGTKCKEGNVIIYVCRGSVHATEIRHGNDPELTVSLSDSNRWQHSVTRRKGYMFFWSDISTTVLF